MTHYLDITDRIGELYPTKGEPEWPMYSFDRPSYMLWNAIATGLTARGWTEQQIKDWLQSKGARWALDADLGEAISQLGCAYASAIVSAEKVGS